MTGFKIYEGLKTLSINLISPRKYLVGSFRILKHHKEIIRSSVFTNAKNKLWCARCVYLSVHFCFFKETWGQQNKTQTFLFTLFHLIKEKNVFTKKVLNIFFLRKKKNLQHKKIIVWLSIMKKFTNSPEKNHLVSNIKEILAKNCCWEKRIHRRTNEKKIKKKKNLQNFSFGFVN